LSVAVEAARPKEVEAPRRRRVRRGDVVFLVFFLAFSAGGLLALLLGVGSVLASVSEPLHDSLHIRALGTGFLARSALRMADAAHEVGSWPQVAFDYAFSILNFLLAIFLLWLRPRDRTARLLAVGMVGTAGAFNLTANTAVEIVPLIGIEEFGFFAAQILGGLAYIYALLLFPDGRPVPRWPLPALIPLYALITAPVVLLVLRVEGPRRPATLLLIFGLLVPVLGAAAQAYRFRRSETQTEHAQARLLFWALTPALGVGIFFVATQGFGGVTDPGFAGRHLPEQPVEVFRIFQPVFLLVPVALFFGLQRYRLWDIDRVVNRTLVWGLATGLVFGLSFGLVILLQRVLNPFTAGNDIAVALSTLLAVAAFIPLRRRIQDFVDRRFYRQRYDAQRTIEAFSSRLRDELDLEALGFELRGAVSRTMQPSHVTLLLREPGGGLGWQWTYRGQARD
jgi:hypothetical protein